jgi:ribosomal protein L7/L12
METIMDLKYIGIGFVLAIVYYLIKSRVKKPTQQYMSHDSHDDEDIEVLAQSGHKIAAVNAYRQLHKVSLKEAKVAVEAMLAGDYHNKNHVDSEMDLSQDEEILRIAKSGHKIEAIKIYKQLYGASLKEAKEAIESMLQNER